MLANVCIHADRPALRARVNADYPVETLGGDSPYDSNPSTRLHKVRLQRFPEGIWTQRFRKLTEALLRAFSDLYAPSFDGVY